MDKEFVAQVLAFQDRAKILSQSRIEADCEITGFIFLTEGIRVTFDWPHYQGAGSILIPWSDLTL